MNPYLALKAAFRDLIEAAGGNVRASKISRADKARLSRYGSVHEAMHAPIDVISDLEQEVGEPFVTRALAELRGFHLVPVVRAETSSDFTRHLGIVAKETGEAISSLATAVADGVVSAEEAKACLADAKEAQRKLACLIQDLERTAGARADRNVIGMERS